MVLFLCCNVATRHRSRCGRLPKFHKTVKFASAQTTTMNVPMEALYAARPVYFTYWLTLFSEREGVGGGTENLCD